MVKDKLPSRYKQGLARVSDIVSSVYPFSLETEERFVGWLTKYWVSHSAYMEEASTGGTYVHAALETFILKWEFRGKKYKGWVASGIRFLEEHKVKAIATEEYIVCRDYQGTCDLIAEIDWEKYVLDWKNFWLAKTKFGIPQGDYRKPYDKLKKAQLQLSMYAQVKKINKIAVIELREDWYYFYPMERLPKEEIDKIVEDYKYKYVDQL